MKKLLIVTMLALGAMVLSAPMAAAQQQPPMMGHCYTVVEGDTLSSIALNFGVPADMLAMSNGLQDPDYIYPGQMLCFFGMPPQPGLTPPFPTAPWQQSDGSQNHQFAPMPGMGYYPPIMPMPQPFSQSGDSTGQYAPTYGYQPPMGMPQQYSAQTMPYQQQYNQAPAPQMMAPPMVNPYPYQQQPGALTNDNYQGQYYPLEGDFTTPQGGWSTTNPAPQYNSGG